MGLDAVELILAVKEKFGIAIPDAKAEGMITPADLISYVQDAINTQSESELKDERFRTKEGVRQIVREIISDQLGVKEFLDTDEFARDLGLD